MFCIQQRESTGSSVETVEPCCKAYIKDAIVKCVMSQYPNSVLNPIMFDQSSFTHRILDLERIT